MGEPEVIQSILLMPGITSVGEGATGYSARGGGTDQNLILFDEMQIFNVNHLFGFFSSFNPDATGDVQLYKGNIPPEFGGRASSVLDVKSKDGNLKKLTGLANVGLVNSRLFLEGPLIKEKLSFLLAGRYAYPNWILKSIKNGQIVNQRAKFYDGNFKLTFWANPNNKIEFNTYNSYDNVRLSSFNSNSWKSSLGSIMWTSELTPKLQLKVQGGAVFYNSEIMDITSLSRRNFKAGINNTKGSIVLKYAFLENHSIKIGTSASHYVVTPGKVISESFLSGTQRINTLTSYYALEPGNFVEYNMEVFNRLSLNLGYRLSHFINLGEGTIYRYEEGLPKTDKTLKDSIQFHKNQVIKKYFGNEPRFSLRYSITENTSLKLGVNRLFQYIHRISNTSAPQPINVWQVSNPHIRPLVADQISMGLHKNFRSNLYETSIEVYYKKFKDILDYKNGADLIFNPNLETELLRGLGYAYGLEFKVVKTHGKLDGSFAYTYSKTLRRFDSKHKEERINNGEFFPANFDRPHELSFGGNYDFSKRYNLSFQFIFSKGRPYTGPVAKYIVGNDGQIILPHFSKRNQFRIPDYHRLDLSFNFKKGHKKNKKIHAQWSFSIYNVYGRKNVYSIYFKQEPQKQPQAYKLSIIGIPVLSISYQLSF